MCHAHLMSAEISHHKYVSIREEEHIIQHFVLVFLFHHKDRALSIHLYSRCKQIGAVYIVL